MREGEGESHADYCELVEGDVEPRRDALWDPYWKVQDKENR